MNKTSITKNSTQYVKSSVPAALKLRNKDQYDQMFFMEIITVHSGCDTKLGACGGVFG
jgi:hypothetical protein